MKAHNFENSYKKYLSPLTRFVFKRLGSDPEIADQIVTETFSSAWKGYKTFKHKSSFFTWLCRIALNKIADYYKDQINKRSRLIYPSLKRFSQIESDEIPIEEKMALDEIRHKVNQVLNLLPGEKRQLLQYKYYKELSHREISLILKISPKAVEGRLYRAKKAFQLLINNAKG